MKLSSVILTLSITVNIALLAWLFLPQAIDRHGTAVPLQQAHATVSEISDTRPPAPCAPLLWQRFDSNGDLVAVVSRLRAAGFPPKLVRAIITALVAEQFDAERYKIDEVALHTPYWKTWPNSYQDPKVGPALRKLQRDQQDVIKQLLGEPGANEASDESTAWQQLAMGNLPPEKLDQLRTYLASHYEQQAQIYSAINRGGALLAADRERLAALDKSLRDGLSQFLTPAEVDEYNLRNGAAANQLKWMLNPFRATEDEYRTIYPLYQTYLDQFSAAMYSNPSAGAPADPMQKAAQEALLAQIASKLGQQRADDLRLALEPKYAGLNRLVSRLDLPLTAAKQLFDVQQDIQQRVTALRDDAALGAGERADRLASLAQEASVKISAALGGTRGLDAYKQNGGQWISSLTPPPKG